MSVAGDWLADDTLQKLYRSFTKDPGEIRSVLGAAQERAVLLSGGCNRLTEARSARIVQVGADELILETHNFGAAPLPQVPLSFWLERRHWFFVAVPRERLRDGRICTRIPAVLYEPERRGLARSVPEAVARAPESVDLQDAAGRHWDARVIDWSYHGMAVEIPDEAAVSEQLLIRISGRDGPINRSAQVRHRALSARPGWVRLGLQVGVGERRAGLDVERRVKIQAASRRRGDTLQLIRLTRRFATGAARAFFRRPDPEVPVIEFRNSRGERIRAIVDRVGHRPGAPLVLIPPAWGRTKETVAPLALTILETFRAAGKEISVLRFDGTRRRGESFNDPDCLRPGDEYRHFTFSGAVDDIRAALVFSREYAALRPKSIVVVSSSLASIEARRAIADAGDDRIRGWISLVGLIDLHTVLRAVSGGVDYGLGVLRGVKFGEQDLFGVRCDIDRIVSDAIDKGLWFLEDARRDLTSITVPITWIHGRHDAWTDLESVRDALCCGTRGERRLFEIPIGHQIRSSREAQQVFELVASEAGRMFTGQFLPAASPRVDDLQTRERAERRRLPLPHFDLRRFWREYLVGRSGDLGMELLTASSSYRELLAVEVEGLQLGAGDRLADLGCGIGDLAVFLGREIDPPADVIVHALDFVGEGLARQRKRVAGVERPRVAGILADLGVGETLSLPLRSKIYDAVLAGLLLTYLPDPERFLSEAYRILKPGGRLVVSGIRPDTDVSRLYLESIEELLPERLAELFGNWAAAKAAALRRTFLSDVSRILDLEEFGYFRFWDGESMVRLISAAGFKDVAGSPAFGNPPQATVVTARRPE